jgi:HEAT repeat protein
MAFLSRPCLVTAIALASACSWPPRETAERARSAAEQFDRQMNAEAAAWKMKADAEFKKRIADPGSLTVEAADALIAQLESADPQTRAEAAAELANSKGPRGVDPIIRAMRAERDEKTFVVFVRALEHLNDVRAVDAFVEALAQPGMSDQAREGALRAIIRYRSAWRLGTQIREFYDSLTDPEVRERVESVVKALAK